MNKVILIGRLTRKPEMRMAKGNGNAVTKFSLAVTRQFKRDEADFINCVAFGKQAETINQYLDKGSNIAITGNIRTGSYDAPDGSKRYTTDIAVESFEFIGKGNGQDQNIENTQHQPTFEDDLTVEDNGDMPF